MIENLAYVALALIVLIFLDHRALEPTKAKERKARAAKIRDLERMIDEIERRLETSRREREAILRRETMHIVSE
jgi:hypothetical protein